MWGAPPPRIYEDKTHKKLLPEKLYIMHEKLSHRKVEDTKNHVNAQNNLIDESILD